MDFKQLQSQPVGSRVTIRRILIASLAVALSFGLISYVRYLKHHNVQFADEGPVEAAGDMPLDPPIDRDLHAIQQRGTLTVLAPYNSTTYFLYRGEPMGYEYELLKAFAREHDLTLAIEVVKNQKSVFQRLNHGDGDLVAARIVPKQEDEDKVSFTTTLYRTEPALVQQKAPPDRAHLSEPVKKDIESEPADLNSPIEVQARLITKPSQLGGETVILPKGSAYRRTLIELADEISGDINVVEVGGKIDDEALINKVAKGDIEYTVVQDNLAELKEAYFTNIKIRPIIGPSHRVVWATRKNSPQLLKELNRWIEEKKNGVLFERMYKKYFIDRQGYKERAASEYLTHETGKLCPYDPLLKQYSVELSWDWRLLASQAFQESRFKPNAKSWAGAKGLLQLMPATAGEFGAHNLNDPEDNVRGAVRFLKWLSAYWSKKITDKDESLKFILASYNCGAGHIEDAQRLAEKYGGNPERWDDVSYWLLQESKIQYSTDAVVKYGFCRGIEPVTYVSLILERLEHYRRFVAS